MEKKPDSAHSRPGFPATMTGLLTPPVLWAVYFVLIYSLHGVACAGGFPSEFAGVDTLVLIVAVAMVITAVAQGVLGLWLYRSWKRIGRQQDIRGSDELLRARFLSYVGWLNAILFFVATLWIGIPALMLEPCA